MQEGGVLPGRAPHNGELTASAGLNGAVPTGTYPRRSSADRSADRDLALRARLSDEASCAYNESFTVQLRGALERQALRTSRSSK